MLAMKDQSDSLLRLKLVTVEESFEQGRSGCMWSVIFHCKSVAVLWHNCIHLNCLVKTLLCKIDRSRHSSVNREHDMKSMEKKKRKEKKENTWYL